MCRQGQRVYRGSGPWRVAIQRLHALGYTDGEIAEALWDLSDDAIRTLNSSLGTRWTKDGVQRLSEPGAGDTTWTRRMVLHYRRQLELEAHPRRPALHAEVRRIRTASYAVTHGWGHLIQRGPDIERLLVRGYLLGHIATVLRWPVLAVALWFRSQWELLRPSEVDVLTALAEYGRLENRQLRALAGYSGRDYPYPAYLVQRGLVRRHIRGRHTAYELQPGCRRHADVPEWS